MGHYFAPASILLPHTQVDLEKWACVACDQFTSQPEYWASAARLVGDAPSTLNLILPELYLEQPGVETRIARIHQAMNEYLEEVLTRKVEGFIYLERTQMDGSIRCGLVGAIDLEAYSYAPGATPPIRPSENTVVSRIPPRLAVRRGAPLETPHVMMLVDDPQDALLGPLTRSKSDLTQVYDTPLMLEGGHLTGWAVEDPALMGQVLQTLDALGSQESFDAKYPQAAGSQPLTMAVGDGNHSLATAKAYWEEIKATLTPEEQENHPARYCLAEVVNVHSPALAMEPIHRVVFGTDCAALLDQWQAYAKAHGVTLKVGLSGEQALTMVSGQEEITLGLDNPEHPLAVGSLETFLEGLLARSPELTVDYIHGVQAVRDLAKENAVGFLLPDFEKSDLFKGVVLGGVLPRKTFSMGHAQEKRYYMECRRI